MTVSTEDAATPKSNKCRNSNSLVQIQIKSKFEFVPRDTKESEFFDLVDFGGAAFSVETVITDAAQPIAKPIKPMRNKQEWE